MTIAGSLQVAGLEILGVRVYDPVARGFISVDPLASPAGAGWGANVYAFVGNAPVGLVDPWGLSPMTAGEFREYHQSNTRNRAWTRVGGQLGNWANKNADGLALLAIGVGVIVGGIALAATGTVGLIVAGAISGAALSGGLSILTNKNEDGTVDWKKVGLDTVIGGVAGGVGGAAVSLVGKASSLMNAGRATRTALKAERVGAKAGALAQKASGASWYNPMKYMNSWRAQQFGQRAASLSARADEFSQFAAHYGDVGGFARSMSGQTVQGVATNVTSNNLAYATGDFKEHTAGGYARATVSGVGVGAA